MVVVTFRFSNPSTSALGIEVLRVKPGAAATATPEATRATREARREEENIVTKTVEVVDEASSLGHWEFTRLA